VPPVSPEQAINEDQPSKVRVPLSDSSQMEMEQPRIVGDTLRGLVKGGTDNSLIERDVLMADIATLKVHKTDATKTILLGLGIAVVGLGIAAIVATSGCGSFLCTSGS